MKFGIFGGATAKRGEETLDSQGYGTLIDTVLEAEDLGYHSVFLVEHHFSGSGQISASLNLLTYLAAKTSNIRLGTAVTVLPWHNPVLVAEKAASVDLMSGGRLDFGVGKGYRDLEFEGFCVPRDEAPARYEESVDVIVKSWTSDERFDHDGEYWQFKNIVVEPPTIQKPHPPLWTAAGTDDSVARVARSGFSVMFDQFASFERTAERMAVWRNTCAEIGRPFDPMAVALARGVEITHTDAEYEAALALRESRTARMFGAYGPLPGQETRAQPESFADPTLSKDALIGNPDQVMAYLALLQSMGFEYILILLPERIETLRSFAREIMSQFETTADAAE